MHVILSQEYTIIWNETDTTRLINHVKRSSISLNPRLIFLFFFFLRVQQNKANKQHNKKNKEITKNTTIKQEDHSH